MPVVFSQIHFFRKLYQYTTLGMVSGWGINPRKEGNAIALARTPNIDRLEREWPHTAVKTSGEAVGLPEGQMGNSEVVPQLAQARLRTDGILADVSPTILQIMGIPQPKDMTGRSLILP